MRVKKYKYILTALALSLLFYPTAVPARIKLVALPERGHTIIRLDNPGATLIEEERVLTLQKGKNKVDFSWKGVNIDEDSIRLTVLTSPEKISLLNVSYPPHEAALVWEIYCKEAFEVAVRISYLLSNIDRLITYKGITDKNETKIDLKSFLVLRNFSGEDFKKASIHLDDGQIFDQDISHEETKQLLFLKKRDVPIEKVWTFDAGALPWDPEKQNTNVGIPVTYHIPNTKESGLGTSGLLDGKIRIFQEDSHKSTIFLGEDYSKTIPVGEKMKIYIGDSRDIVITQRKMRDKHINTRRNKSGRVVLYDTDELIKATVENFKDVPAILTIVQHIQGQWDMEKCNLKYKRTNAYTLMFEINLPARDKKELVMNYHRRNVR